jgi:hypothetical protein
VIYFSDRGEHYNYNVDKHRKPLRRRTKINWWAVNGVLTYSSVCSLSITAILVLLLKGARFPLRVRIDTALMSYGWVLRFKIGSVRF